MEALLRSSVADYQVIQALTDTPTGCPRYRCQPPPRLRVNGWAMVTELAVDANGWHQLAERVSRITALGSAYLLELYELSPDLDPAASGVYLAAEDAPGGSLVGPRRSIERAEVVAAMAAAAQAVHAMHEAGLTHGWIDGRAIVFTARGPVLAPPPLDLASGVATKFLDWRTVSCVDPDLVCGEAPSRSSDVWSLGATLHGALSDAPLYEGIVDDEAVTAVQRVLFTTPVIDPGLGRDLAAIVSDCLNPDPSKRPETAFEVATRLRAVGARL
jgi:serine/threonine protein kinase